MKMAIMNASITFYAVGFFVIIECLLQGLYVSSQTTCRDCLVSGADQLSPSRGENLTLFCTVGSALGNLTNITWQYQSDDNDTMVVLDEFDDERFVIMVEELGEGYFNHTLYISSVNARDSGRYWCSDLMNISEPVKIDVLIPFNFSYPVCSANGGQNILAGPEEVIELSCEAPVSNPQWLLQWQKTLSISTASIEGTRDVDDGIDVLTASVSVSAAEYHGAVLECFAYCPYFLTLNSDLCGQSVRSICKLKTFYVTDVPLMDTFHIAPVRHFVTEGASVTIFCTQNRDFESGGPTVDFILSTDVPVERVSIPNGHALVISNISFSDNKTTIGCGLYFQGKLYRMKYSTVYVIEPTTTTVGSSDTTSMFNANDSGANFSDITDMIPDTTETEITTFGTYTDTSWNTTTKSTTLFTGQVSSTLDQTVQNRTTGDMSLSSTTFPSELGATVTTDVSLSVSNGSGTSDYPTPDTNASTITPYREPNAGPSRTFIGLVVGCSTAALLLIIVLIVVAKMLAKKTMGHQSSWSPKHNGKRTYWDYRDERKHLRVSTLSGGIVGQDGSFDLDEARLEKL